MIHYYRYLFVKIKVFNYSELHFSEVTSYKIPNLDVCNLFLLSNSTSKEKESALSNQKVRHFKPSEDIKPSNIPYFDFYHFLSSSNCSKYLVKVLTLR